MESLVTFGVAALFLLLPAQFVQLPANMAPADVAGAVVVPLCWIWLLKIKGKVLLPCLPAMLLILLPTGLATLNSTNPSQGFGVLVKEAYLYAWLVTFASLFASLEGPALRRLMLAWCAAGFGNGALILAQFVHPPLLATMNASLSGLGSLDPYRPSGLMANCNAAAMFQLMTFVPLLTLGLAPGRLLLLGTLLFSMVLGTGSMGAVLSFVCGLLTGVVTSIAFTKDLRPILRFGVAAVLGAGLLIAGAIVLVQNVPELERHFQWVFYGRREQSAESRFEIWSVGSATLLSEVPLWGIGPDMSKPLYGHEMHNDLLSFAVERGLMATLGLILFCYMTVCRAVRVMRLGIANGDVMAVIFPAAAVAMLVHGQTHEVFHLREIWLVFALQEALVWRLQALPGPVLPCRGNL